MSELALKLLTLDPFLRVLGDQMDIGLSVQDIREGKLALWNRIGVEASRKQRFCIETAFFTDIGKGVITHITSPGEEGPYINVEETARVHMARTETLPAFAIYLDAYMRMRRKHNKIIDAGFNITYDTTLFGQEDKDFLEQTFPRELFVSYVPFLDYVTEGA